MTPTQFVLACGASFAAGVGTAIYFVKMTGKVGSAWPFWFMAASWGVVAFFVK